MITEDMWNNFLATEFEVTFPDCTCGCGTKSYTEKITPAEMWERYMKIIDLVGMYKAFEEGEYSYEGIVGGGGVIKVVRVTN